MKKMKRGFTIVELVIVIGVIAILSAILIPTFVNLTDKANQAKAKQEVADAYTLYLTDVSDGYVGEPFAGIEFEGEPLKQNQVAIKHGTGESADVYTWNGSEWKKEGTAGAVSGAASYNNCVVCAKA